MTPKVTYDPLGSTPPMFSHRPGELMRDDVIELTSKIDGKGYKRTGGCHKKCGACCEVMMLPIDPRVLQDVDRFSDWRKWVELHGVKILVGHQAPYVQAYIPMVCKHLQEDKSCGVYGTEERPEMCSRVPFSPYDIAGTGLEETCSYKWEEVSTDGRPTEKAD